jgi:group I intron endonuclease
MKKRCRAAGGRSNSTLRVKSGVYEIRHRRSGKRYVGSAANIVNRWTVHRCHLRRGSHHCQHLQRAWNKYGEGQFVFAVLERCPVDRLAKREQYHMDSTRFRKLMNCHPVARSSRGYNLSSSARAKIKAAAIRVAADPRERRRRSARARWQWANGRLGRKRQPVKPRICRECGNEFVPERLPSGPPSGTGWCDTCRPPHKGGNYKYERALWGEGRPKQLYRGGA